MGQTLKILQALMGTHFVPSGDTYPCCASHSRERQGSKAKSFCGSVDDEIGRRDCLARKASQEGVPDKTTSTVANRLKLPV